MLWPITTSGSTPHERHSWARAISMAHNVGWMTSSSFIRSSSAERSNSMTDQPVSVLMASSQASMASRKTGSLSRSSRPMPGHCEPCPGKTNATRGGVLGSV